MSPKQGANKIAITSRQKVTGIFDLDCSPQRSAFWPGEPRSETLEIYLPKLGLSSREQFFDYLQDDCRWLAADDYQDPNGRPMFDCYGGREKAAHGTPGVFAEADSLSQIEEHPWPKPECMNIDKTVQLCKQHPDKAVFSGLWSPFFHICANYFGMENYFTKMYTEPKIVQAVTEHVVDFYVEANRRYFQALGDAADIFFFGNDFGTQLDLLISPEMFRKFVLPGIVRLVETAKKFSKKVLLHCCGSIAKIIPLLIDAGIDALHPLQTKAKDMDAQTLARNYKGKFTFVGAVDTQHLLIHSTPEQVKQEVRRLRDLLGPNYIVSPSHEAILPNVPLENVIAMSEAARE